MLSVLTDSSSLSSQELPAALYEELFATVKGGVYPLKDKNFAEYSKLFNGNVTTPAKAVICPIDAEDVSTVILFCRKHSLSPSVKAGGYGIAGWAIGGDIIIDVSKIVGVEIEAPDSRGGYTALRDTQLPRSKVVPEILATAGKRRREDDDGLRSYDSASSLVAGYLAGPPLPSEEAPSAVRRRVDLDSYTVPSRPAPAESISSDSVSGSNRPSDALPSSSSTVQTLPSSAPPKSDETPGLVAPSTAGPFGYMDVTPAEMYRPSASTRHMYRSFGAGVNALALPGMMPAADDNSRAIPTHAHAYVTFGAGMRQKEIDTYTAAHPLQGVLPSGSTGAIPYHVPFSAHPVGSSIMLLSGFGFQSRLRGFSIDNLVEVEMVLADGRIVIINKDENPDLWWAVRGGGTAFGVATRYKAKAYPLPVVFAGNLIYRFHTATAPSLIKHFRDCVKGAPRELYANVILTAGPAGKDSLVVIQMCYIGTKEQGMEFLQAIASWDGERCLLNEVHEKSFLRQQDSVAQVLRGKAGRQWFIRSALITSLPDDIINQTVLQFANGPVGCTWLFELAGGALTDYEDTCIPKSQREVAFTVAALHQWDMGVLDDRCRETAEEWVSGTLLPVNSGGPFPGFLARHEPPERIMACFGTNWERLREVKEQYDPTGLFRNSFWPLDIDGQALSAEEHEPPSPV